MDQNKTAVIEIPPKSWHECLRWFLTSENYTLKMFLAKSALLIPSDSFISCKKFQVNNKIHYLIEFKLRYTNVVAVDEIPNEFLHLVQDEGVLTAGKAFALGADKQYLKKFYRHFATMTYTVFVILFMILLSQIHTWLKGQIVDHQWLVRDGCDVECAKKFLNINAVAVLVFITTIGLTVWAGLFYYFNRNVVRRYNQLSAFRQEVIILALAGLLATVSVAQGELPAKYFKLISNYRNGTLNFRKPASK